MMNMNMKGSAKSFVEYFRECGNFDTYLDEKGRFMVGQPRKDFYWIEHMFIPEDCRNVTGTLDYVSEMFQHLKDLGYTKVRCGINMSQTRSKLRYHAYTRWIGFRELASTRSHIILEKEL